LTSFGALEPFASMSPSAAGLGALGCSAGAEREKLPSAPAWLKHLIGFQRARRDAIFLFMFILQRVSLLLVDTVETGFSGGRTDFFRGTGAVVRK
jgi:hypothetical protein